MRIFWKRFHVWIKNSYRLPNIWGRILLSKQRFLRFLMPNEHPDIGTPPTSLFPPHSTPTWWNFLKGLPVRFLDGVDTRTGFSEWDCYPKCLFLKDKNTVQKIEMDVWKSYIISTHLQSKQVKRTPQDSINELILWKMNPLVVAVSFVKFKSAFLHV